MSMSRMPFESSTFFLKVVTCVVVVVYSQEGRRYRYSYDTSTSTRVRKVQEHYPRVPYQRVILINTHTLLDSSTPLSLGYSSCSHPICCSSLESAMAKSQLKLSMKRGMEPIRFLPPLKAILRGMPMCLQCSIDDVSAPHTCPLSTYHRTFYHLDFYVLWNLCSDHFWKHIFHPSSATQYHRRHGHNTGHLLACQGTNL